MRIFILVTSRYQGSSYRDSDCNIYIYIYIYILRSEHHNIVHRYIIILSDVYIFGVDPFLMVYLIFNTTVLLFTVY